MKKRRTNIMSGVQGRFLKYSLGLLGFAMIVLCIIIAIGSGTSMTDATIENFSQINEKMKSIFSATYSDIDESMENLILNKQVQDSLKNSELDRNGRSSIIMYLTYLDNSDISNAIYIDNKGNYYCKSTLTINWSDGERDIVVDKLGNDYSKTKMFKMKDTLFSSYEERLYAARKVRNMEYYHDYGIIIYSINESIFDNIVQANPDADKVTIGVMDDDNSLLFANKELELSESSMAKIEDTASRNVGQSVIHVDEGCVIFSKDEVSEFTIFTFIPESILVSDTLKIIEMIVLTFIIIVAFGIVLSVYYAKRFTRPIKEITEAMEKFDGTDFTKQLSLNTSTELDTIGQCYNNMLNFTEELIDKVKINERKLQENELKMLMEQIHPHFLYNTLDNIYMMARINKDENIMKMIQALSSYLRISLSKGKNIISVEEELTHAKSYMDILKTRNSDLFEYEIESNVDEKNTKIMKILLQPLVENAVKYGFVNMYEGGFIKISINYQEDDLEIKVFNNGEPIDIDVMDKINNMCNMDIDKVNHVFKSSESGYGVGNVVSRLRLMYEDDIKFYFVRHETGSECVIRIPRSSEYEKDI